MATPRLNRNAPYATIHPPHLGAMYEQSHMWFDGQGNWVGDHPDKGKSSGAGGAPSLMEQFATMSAAEKAELRALLGVQPAKPAAGALSKAHGGPTMAPPKPDNDDPGAGDAEVDDPNRKQPVAADAVDLVAWLRGERNYPFFKVKKAVTAVHPDIPTTNTASIVAGLMEHEMVTPEELKRA